jgi:hypothetical protein
MIRPSNEQRVETSGLLASNLLARASWHLNLGKKLLNSGEATAALFHSNFVFQYGARAYLLRVGKHVQKGEVLQLFLREADNQLDSHLKALIWRIAFPLNQLFCRVIEPSIDIPIRSFPYILEEQLKHLHPTRVLHAAGQFLVFAAK